MNTQEIEIQLLIDAVRMKYGYDFTGYSRDMLTRRILIVQSRHNFKTVAEMIPHLLQNPGFLDSLIYDISITVTEMFRDPAVYLELRQKVMPLLRTYPFVNIWHAGCATGEEIYSMAIMLKEEGLYDRAQIYATDINDSAIQKAKDGIYSADRIQTYTRNYQLAGGTGSFSDYYHAKYGSAKLIDSLKKNITFANHNLVTDSGFAEMHLIMCRNVFIYFDKDLQDRALNLFSNSLCRGGFLCLGNSESIRFSSESESFDDLSERNRIFQKNSSKIYAT